MQKNDAKGCDQIADLSAVCQMLLSFLVEREFRLLMNCERLANKVRFF